MGTTQIKYSIAHTGTEFASIINNPKGSIYADQIYWGDTSFFNDTKITSTEQLLQTIAANAGGGDAAEITTSTSDYISIDETDKHKIGANVVNIANYANLTLNEETGKWESPDDTTEVTIGLADASDIAATIVSDEKVIAAALNSLKKSITDIGTPNTAGEGNASNATGLYEKIETIQETVAASGDVWTTWSPTTTK